MGIDAKTAILFLREGAARPFTGSMLQMGKQDVAVSWTTLRKLSQRIGFRTAGATGDDATFVSDVQFFKYLGFSDVHALDNSPFEGADIVVDMNTRTLPSDVRGRFDAIFDGGTMEHVFDGPQFLKNMFDMLKVGGRIVHFSPTFNHINHGFYAYSPTLFLDYYRANNFTLHQVLLIKDSLRGAFISDCLDEEAYRHVDKLTGFHGTYYTFVVASKREDSTSDRIPQQGLYVSLWNRPDQKASRTQGFLKRLYRRNVVTFQVLDLLRRRVHKFWIYRWYAQREVKWTRLR